MSRFLVWKLGTCWNLDQNDVQVQVFTGSIHCSRGGLIHPEGLFRSIAVQLEKTKQKTKRTPIDLPLSNHALKLAG